MNRRNIKGKPTRSSLENNWVMGGTTALVLVGIMLVLPASARSQSLYYANAAGEPTFSTPESTELGFVNLANGDLHLTIPLGDAPQRGSMSTNARLVYDGRIWVIVNNGTSQSWQPVNLANFGFSSGGWNWVSSDYSQVIGYDQDLVYCSKTAYTAYYGPFYALDGDGTAKIFPVETQNSLGCGQPDYYQGSAYEQYSTGAHASINNYTQTTVYDHAGVSLSAMKDSNGNDFTVSSGNLVDTLARTPLGVSHSGLTYTLTVPNAEGSNSSYTVTFTNINVDTSFGVSGVTEYSGTIEVVSSIAFPDGTSYSFSYDSGASSGHYGELTGVTLRTGGTVTYGWTNFTDSYGNIVRWLTSRTFAGGTWSYSPSVISTCTSSQVGCQQKVTESKPSGDEAVYTFTLNNGAWNTEADYNSGPSTLLKKVTTTYDFSNACPSWECAAGALYIRPTQEDTSMPSAGGTLNSQDAYSYDNIHYGNVTAFKQWNYTTGSFGSTPDRETDYTYLNSSPYINADILNRVTNKTVYQSGVQQAQTLTTYDSTGLTSITGVTHHDDTNYGTGNTVRGNPTVVQQWVSGSTYLSTTNYYDTTGQLVKSTDPASNSILYSYADNFSGYTPPAPTNAYQTQVTLPVSGTLKYSYYFGTGQKASATDQNSQTTTYQFNDPLNRPTETTLPGGAWTLTTYTGAIETDTYNNTYAGSPSSSCSSCVHNETLLDEWGRTEDQVLESDPAGATTVASGYDAQSRLTSKSNPYRSTSDPTYGIESYAYDGLDRQISNTHADNNVAYTYLGANVTSGGGISSQLCSSSGYPSLNVDEAGHKQQTWTDVFGNPVEVDQEDSTGALSLATCYQHDALNDLTSVAQGGQTRSYSYDGLGRETAETTPEAGTVSYYFTASGGGVCAGDASKVCRRTDARGITTTYTYDAENRLTQKSYSDSTPAVRLGYDESSNWVNSKLNLTFTNSKGRLSYTSILLNDGTYTATYFSYDPAGRVQDFWECTPYNCEDSSIWNMHYQYTAGGYVNDYVHPAGYTITNNFANDGRNEEIQSSLNDTTHPGTLATLQYAPQGTLDNLVNGCAGSGCTSVRQDYDYNNRLQLVRLQLGSQTNESSMGCWVYNYYPSVGNPTSCAIPSQGSSDDGNIVGTYYSDAANSSLSHTAAYTYDPTHRLTSAVATGDSTYNLAFSFDQYGNMTCSQNQNTNGPCPQYSFNSSTNQISNSGYTYDASGDLTGDGVHTYQYDAEGRLISVDSGSTATYVYNGLGERVEKVVSGTYTEYMFDKDGNPLGENNRTTWTDTWVLFNGQHVAHYQNGETYFMHANSVGTTAFVTDYTGGVIQDETHYPWGQEWQMAGTMQEERYASLHHRDSETSLDPTHFRMYSSTEYRWFTPDPLQADIFNPQSSSGYTYALGNATNFTDPTGLFAYCPYGETNNQCNPPPDSEYYIDFSYYEWSCLLNRCALYGGQPVVSGGGGGGGAPRPAPKPAQPSPPTTASCYTVWWDALKDAINPFGPGLTSLVEPGAAYLSAVYYNQALGYAASQALTYPFKSSVFRGLLSFSNDIAASYPLIQLDAALFQADVTEALAARSGRCH